MTRRLWFGGLLLTLVGIPGAGLGADSAQGRRADEGYVAAVRGTCDELVMASRVVPVCDDTLLNVDFANGRVAFVFAGRVDGTTVLTVLSGGASKQSDLSNYELTIDRMSTVALGDVAPGAGTVPAEGTCTMRGDPMHEPARFECRVRSGGRETIARFRSERVAADAAGREDEADDVAPIGHVEFGPAF